MSVGLASVVHRARASSQWLLSADGSMGQRVARGAAWLFAGEALTRLLSLIKLGVLGRLLGPFDFGLMGVALLAVRWTELATASGVSQALIEKKGEIRPYLDSAFAVQVIRGLLLSVGVLLLAPVCARLCGNDGATPVVRAVSCILFLRGLINPAVVYLRKEMDFHREMRWRLAGSVAGAAVAIAAAAGYPTVWALVASVVVGQIVETAASYVVIPYRPRFRPDMAKARELLRFGKWIFWTNLITLFSQYADSLWVARWFGAFNLGVYQVGSQTAAMPAALVGSHLSAVALSAFAKMERGAGAAYLRLLQAVFLLTLPVCIAATLFAEPLVAVALGPKWAASVDIVRYAVWTGAGAGVIYIANSLFVARGRPNLPVWIALARSAAMLALMALLTSQGAPGIAAAVMISTTAGAAASTVLLLRLYPARPEGTPAAVALAVAAAAPFAAVRWVFGNSLSAAMLCGLAAACGVYLFILMFVAKRELFVHGQRSAEGNSAFSPPRVLHVEVGGASGGSLVSLEQYLAHSNRQTLMHDLLLYYPTPDSRRLFSLVNAHAVLRPAAPRRVTREGLRKSQCAGVLVEARRWLALLRDMPLVWTLYRRMSRGRYDLVHVNNTIPYQPATLLAARLARIPVIGHVRNPLTESPFCRFTIALASRVAAINRSLARRIQSWGVAAEVRTCYNAVEAPEPREAEAAAVRRQLIGSGQILVGSIGRLARQKGYEHLIEAASAVVEVHPEVRFAVAGDGPLRPRLEALLRERSLTDRFVLCGHRTDVAELLAAFDVFVCSSLWEGGPRTVVEALLANKPVVSTNVGFVSEFLPGGERAGLVVPPGDPVALAAALLRAIDARDELAPLYSAWRDTAAMYADPSASAQQLDAYLRDAAMSR